MSQCIYRRALIRDTFQIELTVDQMCLLRDSTVFLKGSVPTHAEIMSFLTSDHG